MQLLISSSHDPYFNLATEEFLLKSTNENLIFLYQNSPCVVVGKHQNAMAEINYRFVTENKIPVVRRISGGGTVYHDEGNINFTFFQNGEEGKLVNFKAFISPIAEFLNSLGAKAEIGSRNDILINNLKVSGNAEHIYKKRILHHGTLLFSSALTDLRNALHTEPKYQDKAVKSVRSKVSNISDHIQKNMEMDEFYNLLVQYIKNHFNTSDYLLNVEATDEIKRSAETKYMDWNWNFGYSPDYTFTNHIDIAPFKFMVSLKVEKGIIKDVAIDGTINKDLASKLIKSLINQPHSYSSLSRNAIVAEMESMANTASAEIFWSLF